MTTRGEKIEAHRRAIERELGQLRGQTARFTYVDKNGNLKVNQSPELANIQAQIKAQEQALDLLNKSASRVAAVLKELQCSSFEEVQERRRELIGIIDGSGPRAWEKFRMLRELPTTSGGYPSLLPGELVEIESYKQFEQSVRVERDKAQEQLDKLSPLLEEISRLTVTAYSA